MRISGQRECCLSTERITLSTCQHLANRLRAAATTLKGLPAMEDACSLGDPLARKHALDAAVGAAEREIRRERRKIRATERSVSRSWQLPLGLQRTALIIYAKSGYIAEPAVKYLLCQARKRHWPEKPDTEVQEIVENCFLGIDLQEFGSLTDEVNPFDPMAMKEALGYLEQWRLVVWARGANEDHGVAPSTGSLLQRFQEAAAQWPEEVRPPVPADVSQAKARMWARRWRNRWCGRFARIRVREDISAAELLEKVGLKFIRTCK